MGYCLLTLGLAGLALLAVAVWSDYQTIWKPWRGRR